MTLALEANSGGPILSATSTFLAQWPPIQSVIRALNFVIIWQTSTYGLPFTSQRFCFEFATQWFQTTPTRVNHPDIDCFVAFLISILRSQSWAELLSCIFGALSDSPCYQNLLMNSSTALSPFRCRSLSQIIASFPLNSPSILVMRKLRITNLLGSFA